MALKYKELDESVGQGQLYAPPENTGAQNHDDDKSHGVIEEASKDVRAALVGMKDVVMDKLSALHLPAEVIEAGRKSMENLIREVTHTYDNAKGAVIATKLRIVSSIPGGASKDAQKIHSRL